MLCSVCYFVFIFHSLLFLFFFFFFLMIRRPPRSTLFPYTSSSDLCPARCSGCTSSAPGPPGRSRRGSAGRARRSEEHTSELQSRRDLVCRLLLEKKKTKENMRQV